MMRKLLYSFLFFISSESFFKRLSTPSLGLLCVGMFFVVSFSNAATRTATVSGLWNSTVTWGGNSVPVAGDDVIINPGITVTVNASAQCTSITFIGTGATVATLTVNATLNVSGVITLNSATGNITAATIGGTSSLTCNSMQIGTDAGNFPTGTRTTILTSNISNLNISNNLVISSFIGNNTSRILNSTFNLVSGTVNIDGQIITDNESTANISTFSMATGAQSGILLIGNTTPFSIDKTTDVINLNGTGSTVNYDRAGLQNVLGTTYNNLILSSGGAKTLASATVANGAVTLNDNSSLNMSTYLLTLNGNLVNNGSGTITGATGGVTISGGNTQNIAGFTTTGTVLMNKTGGTVATFVGNVNGGNLTISGSTTATTLNLGSGLVHTFTGNWTRTGGTLNGGSSTLKIGGDVSGFTTATFVRGTSTVEYNKTAAQNLGSAGLTYYNLALSGSGLKTFGAATTATNLWSIATGVQAALGSYAHSAAILTLGGAGPLTSTWGSTSSNPVAANTNDTFFTIGNTGRITVTATPPGSAIDNNYASYSVTNGMSGDIAGTSGEYSNPPQNTAPGSVTLTAPAGTVFINVKFASYGSPGGNSPNFTIGSCHAFNSRTVTTTLLGNTTATIPSSGNTFNQVFGDPCYGIVKSYNVVATYSTPICAGTNPGRITGSTPTGGNVAAGANGTYSYLWEVSTTDATSGYSVAPGVSDGKDYDIPDVINVPTWYRRTVTSGIYSDATIVVIPVNIPGQLTGPTSVNPTATSICAGTAVTLSVNGGTSGTNKGGYAEWTLGSCTGPLVGRSTLLNGSLTITPTADATYYVKYKNACGETACASSAVTVTNPTSITLDSATSTRTICSPSTATNLALVYTATKGNPTTYSIVWSTAAINAGFSNRTDIAFTAAASNGAGTISNAFTLPANVGAGTYTGTLTVKAGSCVSFGNTISVTINPRPTSVVSGTAMICRGASTPISVTFTGTAPWNFSYSYGGTTGTYSTSSNPYTVNVSPTTSTTYSITALSDGTGCNAVAGDITGTATITVNTAPSITIQPSAQAICSGSNTTFGVVASGTGLIYKWQVSTNGGVSFSDLSDGGVYSNTTTATMSITGATAGMDNYRYQVAISGTCTPAVISNAVVLTVNTAPSITTQPSAQAICSGSNTTFGVTASGSGLTYKWQISTNGGTSFSDLSDAGIYSNTATATMSLTGATAGMNDYRYQVVVSGTCTPAVTSNAVVLAVNPKPATPSITKNNDVSCGSFGSITLEGLSGNWTINQTGDMGLRSINGATATHPIQDLTAGTHYFTVTNTTTGCTSNIATVIINDITLDTEWDGSGWTNGLPDGNKRVTISSIGSTQPFIALPQTNIDACSLIITAGADVTVPSGVTLNITNAITSNGKLVFESGSSLLQGKDAINTGDIVYKREVNLSRYDVVYWSMPVIKAGFTMHDLSPNTLYDKYFYWDAANGKWVYNTNGTEPMKKGEGYNIRAPQDHSITSPSLFTGVFTGVPNNGDINVTVVPNKWNFLGNPYPSAVDADELILVTNKDVLGALYFWTHSQAPQIVSGTNTYRYISSDYLVYNGVGSIRVNDPSSPTDEFKGNIGAGQGFFAMPTVSQIKFNNDLRRGSSENTQFYKTAKTSKIEKNRLWLNVANSQGAFKQMLIGYIEGATNAIDVSYDAITMGSNSYVDFYSINSTKKLAIQGRALPFDNTEVIPLGFKCGISEVEARTFTISIDHADGFFATQDVYLEDKALGIITDLRKGNYTFTIGTGTYSNRFALRYTNKTLGNEDFENLENTVLVSVKDKAVNITSSKETIKEVNVYNVGAQLLYSNSKVNASQLQIKNLHSTDQVLLVKITLENGHTFTKKVIFSNL